MSDETSQSRFAQPLFVNVKQGIPPNYADDWSPLYDAKVESITQNINATPDQAVFWFPNKRWNEPVNLLQGDKIQITDEDDGVIFEGFIVKITRQFSGGDEKGGKFERLAFICMDYRFLMAVSVPMYGQLARGYDDYDPDTGEPLDTYSDYTGRRCIFNPIEHPARPAKGNCDLTEVTIDEVNHPLFYDIVGGEKWTVYKMLRFILWLIEIEIGDYITIDYTLYEYLAALDDWLQTPNHIIIEGQNAATALQLIVKQIGWAYRLDYEFGAHLVFFQSGKTTALTPDATHPVIQQTLFAPAPVDADSDEESTGITAAVAAGKVIVQSALLDTDITGIVNTPIYFGARHRVEFTAELVPGWKDADLVPDVAKLFFTEAELAIEENPNQFDFYKYYHTKGSLFKRDVGRIWVLNENGRYTGEAGGYDRGDIFDLTTVLPAAYAYDDGDPPKRRFGPFSREFLPPLTCDPNTTNPADCLVELSLDGGATWHKIDVNVEGLSGQCGIIIKNPNLAEIKINNEGVITEGVLNGVELNYFTSLCDDKVNACVFKNDEWATRLRITASIQLDQRLAGRLAGDYSGSPFNQVDIWDHSNEYHKQAIDVSSIYSGSGLPSDAGDDTTALLAYVTKLRASLQDASISGVFVLERLWLDKFRLGDVITKIEGRDFDLRTAIGAPGETQTVLCPEIVQIEILPQQQKMRLITRDLKYSVKR